MQVFEIFQSLQGETSRVGVPMQFVRLAGCDLACSYCDTPQARNERAGRVMTVAEVLAAVADPPLEWIAITGGEPALQAEEVNALIDALLRAGRRVVVETSGAHPIDSIDPRAVRIVDVKTPGSGMADRNCRANLDRLTPHDEVKFVLTGRDDYEWAKRICREKGPDTFSSHVVLFGAARPHLDLGLLASWILADALPVRLNLQIHRELGLR